MRLFIIGNGFDLAHNLKTSYMDFKDFLIESYFVEPPNLDEMSFIVPSGIVGDDGSLEYDERIVVEFLLRLIEKTTSENWSNFEESLGAIDYNELLKAANEVSDRDGEINYYKTCSNYEEMAINLIKPIREIKVFFKEWIRSIEINNDSKIYKNFLELINVSTSVILNFNYTETIERLYGAKNVIHVHGKIDEDIIVGHGTKNGIKIDDTAYHLNAEYHVYKIHESLRKKVKDIIKNRLKPIKYFDEIKEVYSYGFSFSNIDMDYVKYIIENIDDINCTWYLDTYSKEKNESIRLRLKDLGYKGKFETFNV